MAYTYKIEPRDYQREAMKLIYKRKRVLLAYDMGTGKTKIALDFIGVMKHHKKIGKVLIIALLTGLDVWEDEIAKNWDDNISYSLLRPDSTEMWRNSDVVLVNFDYARRRWKELREWSPDVIIIDESHKIKNPYAKQSKAAHHLGKVCQYAICLTGTPIGNHPLDLWSQFKFLVPDLLDESYNEFKKNYGVWGKFGGLELVKYKNLGKLAKLVHPYVTSLSAEYLTKIGKTFIEVPVTLPDEAHKLYKDMERDFVAYVEDSYVSAPIVLAKMAKLSQIAGGFIHSTEENRDFPIHTAKLDKLREITDGLHEAGTKRVVIFARFIWEMNEIKKVLAPKWVTYQISGKISQPERKLARSLFDEQGGAMVCQIASGSASLNLQASNYVIFYSWDYSNINFHQAAKRIHRMGQDKHCFYYVLLSKGTTDRDIYRLLKQKRDVAKGMIKLIKEAHGKYQPS